MNGYIRVEDVTDIRVKLNNSVIISPSRLQEKSCNSDVLSQEIVPDNTYDGLSKVIVLGMPYATTEEVLAIFK